jgi:hypothetical protein
LQADGQRTLAEMLARAAFSSLPHGSLQQSGLLHFFSKGDSLLA